MATRPAYGPLAPLAPIAYPAHLVTDPLPVAGAADISAATPGLAHGRSADCDITRDPTAILAR